MNGKKTLYTWDYKIHPLRKLIFVFWFKDIKEMSFMTWWHSPRAMVNLFLLVLNSGFILVLFIGSWYELVGVLCFIDTNVQHPRMTKQLCNHILFHSPRCTSSRNCTYIYLIFLKVIWFLNMTNHSYSN